MLKKILPLLVLFALPAVAKPVLTVYTYDSFSADWGPGPAVKKAFEADCNCELKFVALEDGVSLLNRLRMGWRDRSTVKRKNQRLGITGDQTVGRANEAPPGTPLTADDFQ